jgi:hypothetical protein
MKEREAKALGRWCQKHCERYRRVPVGEGWVTGCPTCINSQPMHDALEEAIDWVRKRLGAVDS